MKRLITLCAFVLAGSLVATAKAAPATQSSEPLIGEVRSATLAPVTYCYLEIETTFATLPKDVGPAIDRFEAALTAGSVRPKGGSIFRYPPIKDMNAKFTLQIGLPVEKGTAAPAGLKVIDLPAFKCATLLYTGPMMGMKDAFTAAFQGIHEEGMKPAGEFREAYFYFETPDSDNDVTQIQIGVQ